MAGLSTFDVGECCCGPCLHTICVHGCSNLSLPGADVLVELGGVTIDSGTTDGTGCVVLTLPSSGAYDVTVTATGLVTDVASRVLFCGSTTTITLGPDTGYHCACSCANPFPDTLHITPALGTGVLNWTGALWDSRGLSGTGYTLDPGCLLRIYVSGVLCQTLSPFSKTCDPINIVWHTFFQNAGGCSFSAGTAITVTL